MNNEKRIDEFLKYFAKIGIQNPHYRFDTEKASKQIYHELIFKDISNEDRNVCLAEKYGSPFKNSIFYDKESEKQYQNSPFYRWIKYYENSNKINVIRTEIWPYFCQFISKNAEAITAKEHIKIYIPQDSKHIEKSAKIIFNFLSDNNISHISKIGKEIRFDNIVIRLINEEDAKKLLKFVKNNSYIQEGLIKPNPFAFQQDGIAMACDGDQSYNYTVAKIISMYLDSKKKNDTLDKVSYQDFYHFISDNYKKEFITKNSNLFEKKLEFEDEKSKNNYQHIIALMLKSQSKDFTFNDYINHFQHSKKSKQNFQQSTMNFNQLLSEYINTMSNKYNMKIAIINLNNYLKTGDSDYITRTNDLRDKMVKSSLRNQLNQVLKENHITIEQWIMKKNLNNNTETDINNLLKEAIEICAERFNNGGIPQIKEYLKTGKESYITRNNNLRERVKSSFLREKINAQLEKDNISFEDYIQRIMPNYHMEQSSAKK